MFDDIISECRENAKPFHEREIAEVITGIAVQTPNLLNFQIFPACFGPALAAFKMIIAANGMKKPFFTSWEKYMVLATVKQPSVFVSLAPYVALSASGKENEGFWDGKGRVIDTKAIENLKAIREIEKDFGGRVDWQPSDHFIEIYIAAYFDRLKHLLETQNR